ncbi:hypothetical protein NDU88_004172 [Pleurodeles waltl]|uniref:Uncharacterized protein n=1 Tax=Pleurodeles waltl TaxID=8319 RepID=A0AAV7T7E7_PLEWA|nr:hypothetical protein NDU88_004172 [Pleurodeles waltl]
MAAYWSHISGSVHNADYTTYPLAKVGPFLKHGASGSRLGTTSDAAVDPVTNTTCTPVPMTLTPETDLIGQPDSEALVLAFTPHEYTQSNRDISH